MAISNTVLTTTPTAIYTSSGSSSDSVSNSLNNSFDSSFNESINDSNTDNENSSNSNVFSSNEKLKSLKLEMDKKGKTFYHKPVLKLKEEINGQQKKNFEAWLKW